MAVPDPKTNSAAKLMSLRQYAEHRRVNLFTIQTAIRSGRISVVVDEQGRRRIDPVAADSAFAANTDSSKQNRQPDIGDDPPSPPAPEGATFAKHRAERESYSAKLKKLEYKEKKGKLVDVNAVKRDAFELARAVRNSILAIPDRVAAQLAAETNTSEVHRILKEELTKALQELARVDAGEMHTVS